MADEHEAGAAYLSALRQSTKPHAAAPPARTLEQTPRADAPSEKAHASSPEKRKSPRYNCAGSARIQEAGSAAATWATFADISLHGCYIESATPYRCGSVLALKLDTNGFRIEATGEVRVVYSGLGMGISFVTMSEEDRGRLRELVRSISPPSVIVSHHACAASAQPSLSAQAVTNPAAVLQAILKFFEERHVMGREEFLKILRINH